MYGYKYSLGKRKQPPTKDKPRGTDYVFQLCNYYLSSLREADSSLQYT